MNHPLVERRNMNLLLCLETERSLHRYKESCQLIGMTDLDAWSATEASKPQISPSSCFLFFPTTVSASFWTLLVSCTRCADKSVIVRVWSTFAVANGLPDLGTYLSLILQVSMLWVEAHFCRSGLDWQNVYGDPGYFLDLLRSLELSEWDPVGGTVDGRGGIEASKADPSNGRPVAALSRPLIHIECQGSALQSLDSWLVHLLCLRFAHLRDNDVELIISAKATWADTLEWRAMITGLGSVPLTSSR